MLNEYVRQNLARQITNALSVGNDSLKVVTLSGQVEKIIADAVQQTEHGNYLSLDPNDSQLILESIASKLEELTLMEQSPIVLCSPAVRMYVRQMTERYFPQVPIISYNELEANVEVQSVGVVNVE